MVATVGVADNQGKETSGVPEPLSCEVVPIHKESVPVMVGLGYTVIVKGAVVAHCPALGVKVYGVVALVFKAGDHVPTIPLLEVVGKGLKTVPAQIGDTGVKEGRIASGVTVTTTVALQPLLSV